MSTIEDYDARKARIRETLIDCGVDEFEIMSGNRSDLEEYIFQLDSKCDELLDVFRSSARTEWIYEAMFIALDRDGTLSNDRHKELWREMESRYEASVEANTTGRVIEALKSHRDYLKNGTSLRADGYILSDIMEGMSRKELIEEILSTHSHGWLVENGFIKKTEHAIQV